MSISGYDQRIYEDICRVNGHNLGPILSDTLNPATGAVISMHETICLRCGMDLEEIRSQRIKKIRSKKEKIVQEAPVETGT